MLESGGAEDGFGVCGLILGCAKKEKGEVDMDDVDSRPTGCMPRLSDLAFNAVYREKHNFADVIFCIIADFSNGSVRAERGLRSSASTEESPSTAGKPELRTDEGAFRPLSLVGIMP